MLPNGANSASIYLFTILYRHLFTYLNFVDFPDAPYGIQYVCALTFSVIWQIACSFMGIAIESLPLG